MALPFGPVLLLAVVGAAVFGGLDVRKKKKNGTNGGAPPPPDESAAQVVACANVIDLSGDGKMASLNGGPWQDAEGLDDQMWWALERQRPQITFVMCEPDPTVVQVLEQFCEQNQDFDFYGVYVPRTPEPARSQLQSVCVQRNALVAFMVDTPIGDKEGRSYDSSNIPELRVAPGGNIAETLASILTFAQGVEHPYAEDYSLEG